MFRRTRHFLTLGLGALAITIAGPASAQVVPSPLGAPLPSDSRATFVVGNATTCAEVGFASSTQMGAPNNSSASDANVSGTVATNAGTVNPGQGQELNVTITGANVVVDAVVVKGGNSYNLYTNAAFLPPTLLAPQHYIPPFNGGGTIPSISHWFVCYRVTTPPPTGALVVEKNVVPPPGVPVEPIPVSYTVIVNCNDGQHTNIPVTFGIGGGQSAPITGIPIGTVCTVVEQDTGTFPPGTVVTYTPPGAPTTGVTIGAETGIVVDIVNDFSDIEVRTAPITIEKVVISAPGVPIPESFTARIVCDDGTDTLVTLPGTGGPGTPVATVRVLSLCGVVEQTIPTGWGVSYSVNGGPPTSTPTPFHVLSQTAITVTITNDATSATTTTTTSTTTTVAPPVTGANVGPATSTAPTVASDEFTDTEVVSAFDDSELPFTGSGILGLVLAGLASLLAGIAFVVRSRRHEQH